MTITASAVCVIRSASLGGVWTETLSGAIALAPEETVEVKLASAAGAGTWSVDIFGTDDVVIGPTITQATTVSGIATFTAPADAGGGWALIIRSRIGSNSLERDATGIVRTEYTSTFKIYAPTTEGLQLLCLNETFEANVRAAWAKVINDIIRMGGGGGGGSFSGDATSIRGIPVTTTPPSLNQFLSYSGTVLYYVTLTAAGLGAVPTSRIVTAGAGLTGGGDLSADRTFDVVANADGSIVVSANDVRVGVINDAQHGSRAGGTLHPIVTTSVAGFMSAADKVKIDAAIALTVTAPVNVTKATAAVGVATDAARADHKHDVTTATAGSLSAGASASEGSATSLSRSDHTHGVPVDVPSTIGTTNAIGSATALSRSDHVHAHGSQTDGSLHAAVTTVVNGFMSASDKVKLDSLSTGTVPTSRILTAGAGLTGGGDLSADRTFDVVANADGSIVVSANDVRVGVISDTQHGSRGGGSLHAVATTSVAGFMSAADKVKSDNAVVVTSTAPANVTKSTAVVGVSAEAARADHKHDATTATVGSLSAGASAAEGTATSLARSDHAHAVPVGTPSTVGAANAAGSSSSLARQDHVHAHGDQAGGTLHAVATTSVAGFMSGADKTKLDGLVTSVSLATLPPVNVTKAAAAVGTGTTAARDDHKHDVTTAAAASISVGGSNTEGTATSLARSDHTHGGLTFGMASGTITQGNDSRLNVAAASAGIVPAPGALGTALISTGSGLQPAWGVNFAAQNLTTTGELRSPSLNSNADSDLLFKRNGTERARITNDWLWLTAAHYIHFPNDSASWISPVNASSGNGQDIVIGSGASAYGSSGSVILKAGSVSKLSLSDSLTTTYNPIISATATDLDLRASAGSPGNDVLLTSGAGSGASQASGNIVLATGAPGAGGTAGSAIVTINGTTKLTVGASEIDAVDNIKTTGGGFYTGVSGSGNYSYLTGNYLYGCQHIRTIVSDDIISIETFHNSLQYHSDFDGDGRFRPGPSASANVSIYSDGTDVLRLDAVGGTGFYSNSSRTAWVDGVGTGTFNQIATLVINTPSSTPGDLVLKRDSTEVARLTTAGLQVRNIDTPAATDLVIYRGGTSKVRIGLSNVTFANQLCASSFGTVSDDDIVLKRNSIEVGRFDSNKNLVLQGNAYFLSNSVDGFVLPVDSAAGVNGRNLNIVAGIKGAGASANGNVYIKSGPDYLITAAPTAIYTYQPLILPSGAIIRSGAGAPTAADPNGSMYLRTDGGSTTTLYIRAGGAWYAK